MNATDHLGLALVFILFGFTSLRADDAVPGPRNQFNDYCLACGYYDQGMAQVTSNPAEAEKALAIARQYDVLAVREGYKKYGVELSLLIERALKIAQANEHKAAPTPTVTPPQTQTVVSQINSVKFAGPVKLAKPPVSQIRKRTSI